MGEVRPEVVDFILDQGRSASERQLRDADALDAKATQLFSAATVIVGLAGFSGQANAALLAAAVVVYLLASGSALYALWLAKFRVTDSPQQLLNRYWNEPLRETKYAMVTDMAAGFDENERALGRKRRGVLCTLALTGAETALVGAAVIWTLWPRVPLLRVHRFPRLGRLGRWRRRCRGLRSAMNRFASHKNSVPEAAGGPA